MKKLLFAALVGVFATAGAASVEAKLIIDDFTITQSGPLAPGSTLIDDQAIGDLAATYDRTLQLNAGNLTNNPDAFNVNGFAAGNLNVLDFIAPQPVANFQVTWNDFAGGPVDLLAAGVFQFLAQNVSWSGTGNLTLSMTVTGGGTDTVTAPGVASGASGVDVPFNFGDFTGVDFSSVTSITLQGVTPTGFKSLNIGSVSAVTPEPSSFVLAGLGLLAIGGASIRRRRAAKQD